MSDITNEPRRKVYVASSWRNPFQQDIVAMIRFNGHEVYDFRNPVEGDNGFHWSEIEERWKEWTVSEYRRALSHPIAERGFSFDWTAMHWADTCVLLLPCGRSAHIEAGYFVGARKKLVVLLAECEPELMYKMTPNICTTSDEMLESLKEIDDPKAESETLLREAHSLLNSHEITFRLPAVPWRARRDAWNKAVEKVKSGQ